MDRSSGPFRTASTRCPRCRIELDPGVLRRCDRCRGAWLPEDALAERILAIQRTPAQLEWRVVVGAGIACAACSSPMETVILYDIEIDRCRPHGIWFDADELSEVLLRSASVRPSVAGRAETSTTGAAESGVARDVDGLGVADIVIDGPGIAEIVIDVLGTIITAALD